MVLVFRELQHVRGGDHPHQGRHPRPALPLPPLHHPHHSLLALLPPAPASRQTDPPAGHHHHHAQHHQHHQGPDAPDQRDHRGGDLVPGLPHHDVTLHHGAHPREVHLQAPHHHDHLLHDPLFLLSFSSSLLQSSPPDLQLNHLEQSQHPLQHRGVCPGWLL